MLGQKSCRCGVASVHKEILWALGLAGVLASTSGYGLGIRARELETTFQKVGLHGALPPLVWTLWRLILSRLDFRCRHATNR